ncbi:MipA/OmpV family protein [Denitromonas halophila]|uniref:MipA/OmpV family protein n=1 Tax=Denitromonas halophila TaxID=1629404 RepID=A0A557QT61_9RHOO|nr:MipA/OmpV family protein [Denitromonas halophila]
MPKPSHLIRASTLALVLLSSACAVAADAPLWEFGAGVGLLSIPDYRGSDQRQTYALPIPYLVYRGEFLKIDRDKVRGVFYQDAHTEWDISLAASVPVKSDDNRARRDMPDLDPTVEIGPQWSYKHRRSWGDITLRLPLRKVLAVDFPNVRDVGTVFTPTLAIDRDNHPWPGWHASMSTGPIFGDKDYFAYYYKVDSRYGTANRPAWDAKSGYGGWQLTLTLAKRFKKIWVGGFLRADHFGGASFEDSPLVRQQTSWTGGVGVSWIFLESAQRVPMSR